MNEIAEKDRFNLAPDIYRTMEERIEMVSHPDCPSEVLEIVAEHDLDQNVLEAIYFRNDLTDKTKKFLRERLTREQAELERERAVQQDAKLSSAQRVFQYTPEPH